MVPWDWRPEKQAWFARVADAAQRWAPAPGLGIDPTSVRTILTRLSQAEDSRLYHPSVVTFLERDGRCLTTDVISLLWLASLASHELGWVDLGREVILGHVGDSRVIGQGHFHIASLLDQCGVLFESGEPLLLDVWQNVSALAASQFALPKETIWPVSRELAPVEREELAHDQADFRSCLAEIADRVPACLSWVTDVVKVVLPLRAAGHQELRSGSMPTAPGIAFCSIGLGPPALLELLVHESRTITCTFAKPPRRLFCRGLLSDIDRPYGPNLAPFEGYCSPSTPSRTSSRGSSNSRRPARRT